MGFVRCPCSTSSMRRYSFFAPSLLSVAAICFATFAHAEDAKPSEPVVTPPPAEAKKATIPAAGYGYSDRKPKSNPPKPANGKASTKKAHVPTGVIATLPGFALRDGGGTRLFVELTKSVQVEEKKGANQITYVLKGAHVIHHNNTRTLETVHFNTPVTRAKLVPKGKDLWLVVNLRADVTPTWKVEPEADGDGVRLNIDFSDGAYLPKDASTVALPGSANSGDAGAPHPTESPEE